MLKQSGIGTGGLPAGEETVTGTVAEIRSAVIEGNTVFYIRLDGKQVFYTISAADSPATAILSQGDRVTITFAAGEGDIQAAYSVECK